VLQAVVTVTAEQCRSRSIRIVRADGAVRWVLDRGQLVRLSHGRQVDGAIFDITDARARSAAARIEEAARPSCASRADRRGCERRGADRRPARRRSAW
jgi:hypothetical protein